MRLLLTLFICLCTVSTQAALYKSTNENGDTVYSDVPPYAGAKEMRPPLLQTSPAVKYKPKAKPKAEPMAEDKTTKYLTFAISQPLGDETIRNNMGNISVMLKLIPELDTKEGHYINIYLDGKPVKKRSQSINMTLNNIDRGSHSVNAEIRDKQGKVVKTSPSIRFHLHRFSKLHKKPTPTPPPAPSP